MERLGLTPASFDAAQYRAGWEWRMHATRLGHPWACYGQNAIKSALAAPTDGASSPRLVLLTNAVDASVGAALHSTHGREASIPKRVLAEAVIVAKARRALLNPLSTFQYVVRRLRGTDVELIARALAMRELLAGDRCDCAAIDEDRRQWRARRQVCSNATAFARCARNQGEHSTSCPNCGATTC